MPKVKTTRGRVTELNLRPSNRVCSQSYLLILAVNQNQEMPSVRKVRGMKRRHGRSMSLPLPSYENGMFPTRVLTRQNSCLRTCMKDEYPPKVRIVRTVTARV